MASTLKQEIRFVPYLLIAPLSESSLEYPSDYLLAQMARLLLLVCGLSASHGLQLAQSVRPVSAATCAARAVPAMLLGMGGPQTAVPRTVGEAKALQQVTINWRLPCLGRARRAHPHERGRSRSARARPPQGSLGGARGRLTTPRPPLTTHRSPITAPCSPLTAHHALLTAHRSPLAARRSPLTNHRRPSRRRTASRRRCWRRASWASCSPRSRWPPCTPPTSTRASWRWASRRAANADM